MKEEVCVIDLPGKKNYAIVSPHRIVYGLDASDSEINVLMEEERNIIKDSVPKVNFTGRRLSADSIGLIPTFDCNLRCVYCYSKGGERKKTMSLDMAKIAIEKNANNCNNHYGQLDIYLVGGGEPLLPFKLVRGVIKFAKSIYDTVKIHVVTNGAFGDEVLNWLVANEVDVRISYDGVMHNIQRPFADGVNLDSRKVVNENIKALVSKNIFLTVQCIVSNEGLRTLRKTVDEIIEMGVKVLKIEPVLITDVSRGGKKMEPNPVEYAENLLNVIRYVAELNVDLKIDTGYFSEPSNEDYCGIAHNNKIFTPDGLITACVEVTKETDPYANPIIFGRFDKNGIVLDKKKLKLLESLNYKNQKRCVDCDLRFICQGGCPMANIWKSGFPPKNSLFTCSVEHRLIPFLLLEVAENPRVAKVIFNDGVDLNIC